MFLVLCLSVFSLSAQTGEAIYVYRNDGLFNSFLRADVDSITYSPVGLDGVRRSDMATQLVWTADSVYRIPLSVIDSVTLSKYAEPGMAVDLGLSVKWASCNVGAAKAEELGGYYAWGETEVKSDYSLEAYQYYDSKKGAYIDIGDSISGTKYDVARVKWGGSWRMPTLKEEEELCNKCTWTWTKLNGVNGKLVTGPNGKSIFLPAAGGCKGTAVDRKGATGGYRSGTQRNSDHAYYMRFHVADRYCWGSNWYSYFGFSVRPVTE